MQCTVIRSIYTAVQTIVVCLILCGFSDNTASPAVFQLSITVLAVKVRMCCDAGASLGVSLRELAAVVKLQCTAAVHRFLRVQ